ncbi:hypothetical protein AB6A40_005438 [Gnathostoma spinigerum]|uniref:ET module n=1 Tax=Gnathostoma spinigerum TaxID=75299 RepID=A0ABD6EKP5_9BILA
MDEIGFAEIVECEEGAVCQSVFFQYQDAGDNSFRISDVTRSCSFDFGCDSLLNANTCKEDILQFAGIGCETRICCSTDLCNGGSIASVLLQ